MKKDEWALTEELKRLNKFGFIIRAKRTFEDKQGMYELFFLHTNEILEPCCTVEEVMGIINTSEILLSKYIERLSDEKT